MLRATSVSHDRSQPAFARIVLAHDDRHIRRKVLVLETGARVLVDLPQATALADGDRLALEDGRHVEVIAANEELLEIRAGDGQQLTVLAWHIGNRHLPAQIEADRILIGRDHVIAEMLKGLGAQVADVVAPFTPERGAYSGHAHASGHAESHSHSDSAHSHSHSHTHSHAHSHAGGGADGRSGPADAIAGKAANDHA
jgi:urease accessory protein